MKTHAKAQKLRTRWQRGSAAVEFALVAAFGGLFILLFGVIELGRVLMAMNSANEATALGARVAIVCGMNDSQIKARMMQVMPTLKPADIAVSYYPGDCTPAGGVGNSACQTVTVSIVPDLKINTVIPFVPVSIELPEFRTTMTREAMDSAGCA